MQRIIVTLLAIVMAGFAFTANPAQAQQKKAPARLEYLHYNKTDFFCTKLEDFTEWMADSNKYGPIVLEIPRKWNCQGGTMTPDLFLTNVRALGFIKAFNVPVLLIEADSAQGKVYTFVPILKTLPFKPGNGA